MLCSERVEKQHLILTDSEATLAIPVGSGDWGNQNLRLDGKRIPSGRIWALIAKHTAAGEKTPRPLLMAEAKRSGLYIQHNHDMLVYTVEPQIGDRGISGNVFMRRETQRVRPLLERFGIVVAKIEPPLDATSVNQMHEAAETIDLYPVAAGDNRIMYAPDPQAVFDAFGSKDWVRIYVYLKRPGSSSTPLNIQQIR